MSKIQILAELALNNKIEFQITAEADRDFVDEETENALEALAFYDGRIDDFDIECEADCYTSDLRKWFSEDDYAWAWCERALSELGWEGCGETLYGVLGWGQIMAKQSVYYAVVAELKELALEAPDNDTPECIGCALRCDPEPGRCPFYEED